MRFLGPANAPVELTETEVAVGDEGAHATRFCEGECLPVVSLSDLRIEVVSIRRDVAKQVPDISGDGRRFQREVSELLFKRR